jgi:hypothetical protein
MRIKTVPEDISNRPQAVRNVVNIAISVQMRTNAQNVFPDLQFRNWEFWEWYQLFVHKFAAMVKGSNTNAMMAICKTGMDAIQIVTLKKNGRAMQDPLNPHRYA